MVLNQLSILTFGKRYSAYTKTSDKREEKNSEHEGMLESKEEATTSKVKQEKDSEQEGTLENNQEDEMDRKNISTPVFNGENYSM